MFDVFDQRRYLIPFRSLLLPQIFTDTLVIGTGVAGLRSAIEAALIAPDRDVIVLAKDDFDLSNTAWAQGGVAGVLREDGDSIARHVEDTVNAGAGLCEVETVTRMAREAGECIRELLDWGMRADRAADGSISLGREGGHSSNRIVHAQGDRTGEELVRVLSTRLRELDNVRIFEQCFGLDLLTSDDGSDSERHAGQSVLGAITHHPRYGLQIIWASSVILATGGCGQVYRETTNPAVATGDGVAMAWRAGAAIADMAFMQFHPTTLYVAGAGRALITEAIRGEGAHLVARDGRRFMLDAHERAELAPRDVVSRTIVEELARTQEPCVFLDVRHIGGRRFAQRFAGFAQLLKSFDLDPGEDLIPVHPSAHYAIGGVWTDDQGATTKPGLFACGEVACTGVHGANRLASNSLLEGLVYGRRCGHAAAAHRSSSARPSRPSGPGSPSQPSSAQIPQSRAESRSYRIISDIRPSDRAELDLADVRSSLRSAMWRHVGIERSGSRLEDTLDMFAFWARYSLDKIFDEPVGWEMQNMLTVGALITRSAAWREESRGCHARRDFSEQRSEFAVHDLWTRRDRTPRTVAVGTHAPVEP